MFTKALVDGRELQFAFAPPQTDLDIRVGRKGEKKEQRDLPQKPRHDTPTLQRSMYYYWWAFLRLNQDYIACCERGGEGQFAELYGDFGDVRDDARPTINNDGDHFKAWWIERGAYLFAEPVDRDWPEVITDPSTIHMDGTQLLVSVPLGPSLKDALNELRLLLGPHFQQHAAAGGQIGKALYRPKATHSLTSLDFSLRAIKRYRAYEQTMGRKPTSAQVYVMAPVDGEIDYHKVTSPPDTDGNMRSAARAALTRVELWIKNIVYGNFPDDYAGDPATRNVSGMPTAERRALHELHLANIGRGIGLPY
jgi:hypothetical protein